MSNLILSRKSPLEEWVYGYLKKLSKGGSKKSEARFIEKAINDISTVLADPCCAGFPKIAVTPFDNELTRAISAVLQTGATTRPTRKQSLLRILDNLNDVLYGDCCTGLTTVVFETVNPLQVQLQFKDLITGGIIGSTSLSSGATQVISLPAKYFGDTAFVQVLLVVNVSQTSLLTVQKILPSSTTIINATSLTGLFSAPFAEGINEASIITKGS